MRAALVTALLTSLLLPACSPVDDEVAELAAGDDKADGATWTQFEFGQGLPQKRSFTFSCRDAATCDARLYVQVQPAPALAEALGPVLRALADPVLSVGQVSFVCKDRAGRLVLEPGGTVGTATIMWTELDDDGQVIGHAGDSENWASGQAPFDCSGEIRIYDAFAREPWFDDLFVNVRAAVVRH